MKLQLKKIRTDGGTQCRSAGTDPQTVKLYAERMRAGDKFPPVKVFFDGSTHWLADGFHRVEAAQVAGLRTIEVEIIEGTLKDAILFGSGANTTHGKPLSPRDRQNVVLRLLQDDVSAKWTNQAIARHVGVSAATVSKYRQIVMNQGTSTGGRGTTYLEEATVPAIPTYPSDNVFGIPRLHLEYQATELLLPAVKWGTQSRRAPICGTAHFYTDDYKFRAIWDKPHQLMLTSPPAAIEVNYSTYAHQPRAVVLGDMYKKRWMSRYWAGDGIKIFVDLFVENCFFDIALLGVPKGWRAYANRAFTDSIDHLTEAYKVAAKRAGTYDILYVVYGGHENIKDICNRRGWLWIPEDAEVKRGNSQRHAPQPA